MIVEKFKGITLINADCMDVLKGLPDKSFDLAIVDPPYASIGEKIKRTGGGWAKKYGEKINEWDIAPSKNYFEELLRVSKNQIIWGGNYFDMPPTRGFIIWRKIGISEAFTMSMCEFAWTSFDQNAKVFECRPQGEKWDRRIHPCQKPTALYYWLLERYAKKGDKILDTHLGSGSIALACDDLGFEFTGIEIDKEYYEGAKRRLLHQQSSPKLFDLKEIE